MPQQLLHMLEVLKGSTGPGTTKLHAAVLSLLHLSTKPCCATQIDTVVYVHLYDYTGGKIHLMIFKYNVLHQWVNELHYD